MSKRLHGLVAATFTPMDERGAVNLAKVPAATDFVIGQGADGLFVCGSTGEGPSLSREERMGVVDAYHEANAGRVPLVAHVGHNSLTDARAMAAHAAGLAVDAIAVVPPSYFKPGDVDVLVDCLADIAEAAPDTPLYYYHIPPITGVDVRGEDLLAAADERLPSFAGLKFSNFAFDDLLCCIRHGGGRYNVLFGSDEMCLAGMAMGAAGAVGSTYNFLGPGFQRMLKAFHAGDLGQAQDEQYAVTRSIRAILQHGGHNALKATMGILGVDCGPPRLPMKALSADSHAALAKDLEVCTGADRGVS